MTSLPATNVTVNGATATRYLDSTFSRSSVALSEGTNSFTAVAQDDLGRTASDTVSADLSSSLSFDYTSAGELQGNGKHTFYYDKLGRLTRIVVPNVWSTRFVYDGKSRLRIRREFNFDSQGAEVLVEEVRYVDDGDLAVQERDQFNSPTVTYTRGLDLSGSYQGAGGVGKAEIGARLCRRPAAARANWNCGLDFLHRAILSRAATGFQHSRAPCTPGMFTIRSAMCSGAPGRWRGRTP